MNLGTSMFRQDLAQRLEGIKRLCAQWGVPQLGTHITLILRDPTNDNMSIFVTDETDIEDALRTVRYLQERGT